MASLQLELDRNAAQVNIVVAQAVLRHRRRRRRNRTIWVKPRLQRRNLLGQYERLMAELRDEDIPPSEISSQFPRLSDQSVPLS